MRSFTALLIVVTLIHVAAFVVVILIRLWPDRPAATGTSKAIRPCAVCGQPATHLGYDGLDPGERRDPHTGRAYSFDMSHYQPLCAAHGSTRSLAAAQARVEPAANG